MQWQMTDHVEGKSHAHVFSALTDRYASGCINGVKWMAVILLVILQCSCTTLVTRRDLYSPEPGPDSRERQKQLAATITTTTTTMTETEALPVPPPFR